MITKEEIEKKIEEINKAKNSYLAQVNACNGAIQALQDLIKDKPEEKPIEEGGG